MNCGRLHVERTYHISRRHLDATIRRAGIAAKRGGLEICGLLVSRERRLIPVSLRNKIKRGGAFAFYVREARSVIAKLVRHGESVVGTFHSHPYAPAEPGPGDIAYAVDGDLMLIIDCLEERAKLWHLVRGRAHEVRLRRSTSNKQLLPKRRTIAVSGSG
jgi:proteasome lid subunit RPN8/RPN11